VRRLAEQAEAQGQDPALEVRELVERLADRGLAHGLLGAGLRRRRARVGEQVAELGVLLVADRRVERHGRARRAAQVLDLLGGKPRTSAISSLETSRPSLRLRSRSVRLILLTWSTTWTGQAHGAALVGDRAGDRLADPPRRVGRELEALAVVELLRGADEPERPLLDEVEERQAPVALAVAR
jgi:hypothetical protein